jgi:hypothetical protein
MRGLPLLGAVRRACHKHCTTKAEKKRQKKAEKNNQKKALSTFEKEQIAAAAGLPAFLGSGRASPAAAAAAAASPPSSPSGPAKEGEDGSDGLALLDDPIFSARYGSLYLAYDEYHMGHWGVFVIPGRRFLLALVTVLLGRTNVEGISTACLYTLLLHFVYGASILCLQPYRDPSRPLKAQGYRDSDDLDWLAIYTSVAHVVICVAGILSSRAVDNTAYIVGSLVGGTLLVMWVVVLKLQFKRYKLARYAKRGSEEQDNKYDGSSSDSSDW